jgi:hypothetical protein
MNNADLHAHSHYSDGLMSPREVVRLAKRKGIKHLALTDHDSVKGVKEAVQEGKKIGIEVIPAVEIRTQFRSEILGYFVDINNKLLVKTLKKSALIMEKTTEAWCKTLKKAGYDINFKEIWKKYPKARGNINTFYPLWELHLKGYGPTLKIQADIRKKKLKKINIKEIGIIDVIKLIRYAGGVAVLAHPWLGEETLEEKNMKKYVKAGLKGIEINNGDRAPFYPTKIKNKIKRLAKKYNLIITAGSDFHGLELVKQMPGDHMLGHNNCDEKVIKMLKECIN